MTGARHRGNPADQPTRAAKREYYRGFRERDAARNGMSVADYDKYASVSGNTTHPLHRPVGLLVLAFVLTLGTAAILVLAAVQWAARRVNIIESFWVIVLLLAGLTVWSWSYAVRENRAARNRRRDSVTLLPRGHSTFDDGPDPGGPVI